MSEQTLYSDLDRRKEARCPRCNHKLFAHRDFHGTIQTKCAKCKAKIEVSPIIEVRVID